MQLEARAKVNLSLLVGRRNDQGMHPVHSLAQSVDWADTLHIERSDEDRLEVTGDAEVPVDDDNLAMQALQALRRWSRVAHHSIALAKHIPTQAGLGGGSADAAAVLGWLGKGLSRQQLTDLALSIGSDVPFCLLGGRALVEGVGEVITPLPMTSDFALAVVVPRIGLSTPDVYAAWDRLGEPLGSDMALRHVPVSLRDLGPFRNDLQGSAVHLSEPFGDWVSDVSAAWGVPVAMSGSGTAVFGFFADVDEAAGAVAAAPDVRSGRACRPVGAGWLETPPGTLPP